MEHLTKTDDLGVPRLMETSIWTSTAKLDVNFCRTCLRATGGPSEKALAACPRRVSSISVSPASLLTCHSAAKAVVAVARAYKARESLSLLREVLQLGEPIPGCITRFSLEEGLTERHCDHGQAPPLGT